MSFAKLLNQVTRILNAPIFYRFFAKLMGGERVRPLLVEKHIDLKKNKVKTVLDIGCGPADMLEFLPGVEYYGFDMNPSYINSAQQRWKEKGKFWNQKVNLSVVDLFSEGSIDVVLAIGILHHLNDEECAALFQIAYKLLKKGGKLVTFDGCYTPQQSKIDRLLLDLDRGKFVRSLNQYKILVPSQFQNTKETIYTDLLTLPYTHLVMECTK